MNDDIHYIIVRSDLPFGTIAAQVAHAAARSAILRFNGDVQPNIDHAMVVVLEARSPQHISAILQRLNRFENEWLNFVPVYEPDLPWNGALMAIGIAPGHRYILSSFFVGLELLSDKKMKRKRDRKT